MTNLDRRYSRHLYSTTYMCTTDAEFRMSYLHFDPIMLEAKKRQAVLKCNGWPNGLKVPRRVHLIHQVHLVHSVVCNVEHLKLVTFQHSFQHDQIKMKVRHSEFCICCAHVLE